MTNTPDPADLPALVETGLQMVDERLRASPDFPIYDSIKAQLTYIQRTIAAGERPAAEMLDRLTIGVYAAREFETSDPAFADVLLDVAYLFERL